MKSFKQFILEELTDIDILDERFKHDDNKRIIIKNIGRGKNRTSDWAIFIDGKIYIGGLTRPQVKFFKLQAQIIIQSGFKSGIF